MDLQGRVAVVTGTNREIGATMGEALAQAGAAVLMTHYGEANRVSATIERIKAAGGQAVAYDADLRSVAANQALIAKAVEVFGRVDIFAANAGLTIEAPFLETDESTWNTLVDLNLKGSYFGAQAAARQMIAQSDGGRIVFSSSVTGMRAFSGLSAYGITKAGLRHMAQTLALELGPHRITVNALVIGAILNERNLAGDADYAAHWAAVNPAGRVGYPVDVARALLFLASLEAEWITGHTLVVDGGLTVMSKTP
ncbi:MAG: SDR family oxidoreductase [Chloroflexales bacterium]|nr:SDR family oxidoreductase [Chloroflexales bacterium]